MALAPLCCACAILATAGMSAKAGPPGRGGCSFPGRTFSNRFNHSSGFNSINGPYGGIGFGGFGGELFGYELNGNENEIPYFALHPPVYYSYPVAHPYGDSPFANPPGLLPPASDGGPQMIVNPYATPEGSKNGPSQTTPSNGTTPNGTPAPPTPSGSSPINPPANPPGKTVKPTAGRTAALERSRLERSGLEESNRSVESLPAPPAAASTGTSNLHVVLNPFAQ